MQATKQKATQARKPLPPVDAQTVQFIKFVWECLQETAPAPRAQIAQVVHRLGTQKVKALLYETLAIEQSGGELTMDGKRRRTPGGVFFRLCKLHYKYQVQSIFPEPRKASHASEEPAKKVSA